MGWEHTRCLINVVLSYDEAINLVIFEEAGIDGSQKNLSDLCSPASTH